MNTNHEKIDRIYISNQDLIGRILFRLFGKRINAFVKTLLGRGHERGIVRSFQMHQLAGISDRMTQQAETPLCTCDKSEDAPLAKKPCRNCGGY